MKYRVVTTKHGVLELDENNVLPALEIRGHEVTGYHDSPRTRQELQGQPKFSGLLGPMWDGDAIRYEDNETYRALSA